MSQKKARALRKKTALKKPEEPKDNRQAFRLDALTGDDAVQLLKQARQQTLDGPAMQAVVRNILRGRNQVLQAIGKPEPILPWALRIKGDVFGELWLVPQRAEDDPKGDAVPGEVKPGSPSAGVVAEADRKAAVDKAASVKDSA